MDANQITLEEALRKLADTEAAAEKLEKELASERDARGKAEQETLDANKLVDDLNKQLDQKPATFDGPTATLGIGKDAKTYRIVVPQFNLPGHGVVKASEVKSQGSVLKALVEAGSMVLELVSDAK